MSVKSKSAFRMFAAAASVSLVAGMAAWSGPMLHAAEPDARHRLALHLGVAAENLIDIHVDDERLFNGLRLTTVKAVDATTGRPVGASFQQGQVVDRFEAIAAAGHDWRAVNGALTSALLEKLGALRGDDRVEIDLWFNYQMPRELDDKGPQLDNSNEPPPELLAKLEEMRAAEAEAAAWAASRDASKQTDETPLSKEDAARVLAGARVTPLDAVADDHALSEEAIGDAQRDTITLSESFLDTSTRALQETEARESQRLAAIEVDVANVRAPILARLQDMSARIIVLSDIVPSIVLEASVDQIRQMAFWPEVDAIYVRDSEYHEELGDARQTQNAILANDVGYNGAGVIVSVSEGGRVFGENPFLNVDSYCNASAAGAAHATAVAGFIASTHSTHRGLAPNVTLRSGNCATVEEIIDWGSSNARIANHSFYAGSHFTQTFHALDRRMDYRVRYGYDTMVKSAGNLGNGCTNNGDASDFVTTPGKGYNVITVGNYNDFNTLGWGDDAMSTCSSFGNPRGDGAGSNHDKPELAAVGSAMTSTLVSSVAATAVGGVGGGTSYAAPMVAATAANIIQADTSLASFPERIKPIVMVGALHNIEGAARLSDVDGVGGLVVTPSLKVVERGHFKGASLNSADAFPIQTHVLAQEGERVRFVVHWMSNPNTTFTTDARGPDIDLRVYSGSGTLIQTSNSTPNTFEIVDFTAPATDLYRFEISLFGSWPANLSTWYGAAWWRGVDRVSNGGWNTVISDGAPLGNHFEQRPSENSPSNFWRGAAVRPQVNDINIRAFSGSLFGQPLGREQVGFSGEGVTVDFIVTDGNHWNNATSTHYRTYKWADNGADGYQFSAAKHGTLFSAAQKGVFGPYTLNAIQSLFLADIWFDANSTRKIRLIPAAGSNDDMGLSLFDSDPGNSSTFVRSRNQAVALRDERGVGGKETIRYRNTGAGDYLGVAAFNKTWNSSAEFYIQVGPNSIFEDDFQGD